MDAVKIAVVYNLLDNARDKLTTLGYDNLPQMLKSVESIFLSQAKYEGIDTSIRPDT